AYSGRQQSRGLSAGTRRVRPGWAEVRKERLGVKAFPVADRSPRHLGQLRCFCRFPQHSSRPSDTLRVMMKAVTSAAALFGRLGLNRKTLSAAGKAVREGIKKHSASIGTAATVASLVPNGPRGAKGSAASNAEANTPLNRFKAARRM
ncbi:MAG: hypothetical protein AAFV29_24515, partial [Myxococcota bacterium]